MLVVRKSFEEPCHGMLDGLFAIFGSTAIIGTGAGQSNPTLCLYNDVALAVNEASQIFPMDVPDEEKKFFYATVDGSYYANGERRQVVYKTAPVFLNYYDGTKSVWLESEKPSVIVPREFFPEDVQDDLVKHFETLLLHGWR